MDKKSLLSVKRPLILKKANMTVLNRKPSSTQVSFFREDILHDTTDVYFLKGEFLRLILVNRFNIVNKGTLTVAKYFCKDGSVLEKTSDRVTQVIGQDQYITVFTALCSIIDQELKIRSILALLTAKTTDKVTECDRSDTVPKTLKEKSCQTDEMRIEPFKKPRRRVRKQVGPYIIPDQKPPEKKRINKIIVQIPTNDQIVTDKHKFPTEDNSNISSVKLSDFKNHLNVPNGANISVKTINSNNEERSSNEIQRKQNSTETFQDLGYLHDDYSNDSMGGLSALSDTRTIPELLTNPTSILDNVDQHTKEVYVQDFIVQPNFRINGTNIIVPFKPEDVFHIATRDNMWNLDSESRIKLLKYQMEIDKKHCLTVVDEDGNFPIHLAVLNHDLELLNRQCAVLKIRGSSVDITTNGPSALTALKLALYQEPPYNGSLAACALQNGACPLRSDGDRRAAAHLAAERDAHLLVMVLRTCHENARRILSETEDLWKPEMAKKTDLELGAILMKHMCSMFDKQGHTPLMLASMLGLYENVRVLVEHSPSSVNVRMPTTGNTALYLAIAASCNSSAESGNRSKVLDRYRKTIEILLENGADLTIDNHSGTNVNALLQETDCAELCTLVAHKLTEHFSNKETSGRKCSQVMLVKDKQGNVECKVLENERKKKSQKNLTVDSDITFDIKEEKHKPVIVNNILLKPPGNTATASTSVASPGDTKIVDESTKIEKKSTQKRKKIIILSAAKPQGKLKRKISEEPEKMKQVKVEK